MGDIYAFTSEFELLAGKPRSKFSPGGPLRKTLADVTNIQPRPKPSIAESKSELVPSFAKDMDRLLKESEELKKENQALKCQLVAERKENEAYKKQLAERNKIIELSATELQKLRLNLQSSYQQNLQLAQANSQMLAELNNGKDRLKTLHHELGCVKGVLNFKTLALQDKKEVVDHQQPCNKSEAGRESSHVANTNSKRSSTSTRRLSRVTGQTDAKDTTEKDESKNNRLHVRRKSSRFNKSAEPACTDDLVKLDEVKAAACTDDLVKLDEVKATACTEDLVMLDDVKAATNATTDNKEKSKNKRLCVRRQSSRSKSEGPAFTEDLFELDDIKLPMHSQTDETTNGEGASVPVALTDNVEDATEERRMSLRRPSRRAAVKVQSYKEIPLNLKMRRDT